MVRTGAARGARVPDALLGKINCEEGPPRAVCEPREKLGTSMATAASHLDNRAHGVELNLEVAQKVERRSATHCVAQKHRHSEKFHRSGFEKVAAKSKKLRKRANLTEKSLCSSKEPYTVAISIRVLG